MTAAHTAHSPVDADPPSLLPIILTVSVTSPADSAQAAGGAREEAGEEESLASPVVKVRYHQHT